MASAPVRDSRSGPRSGTPGKQLRARKFATHFWHAMIGEPAGSTDVNHVFAAQHEVNIGVEILSTYVDRPTTREHARKELVTCTHG